ncbi:MAG: hypothetical protein OXN17_00515 [Candidatus Poribacteria bacterium]|nr:hypothetical protein [Candidatus Poribacteria bacterium]MDE0506285.1 hypothetical protein [Candidatus Poribacteria bacterium]
MKAGVSRKNITPPTRTRLADHTRYSAGIHDPLFVKSLVLDDGQTTVAIVCIDLLNGSFEFCDQMRRRIDERTGIKHNLLNFSQTHSAPGTVDFPEEPHEKEWIELVERSILDAVEEAYANRIPASLHAGQAPVQIGFNRRLADEFGVTVMAVNETAAIVPWANVLQVRVDGGNTLAVLFEHAAHPVIVHNSSSLTGADFPGFAVQRIEETLGHGVVAMFAQGCCGNINGYPLRSGWKKAEEAGRKLGDAVLQTLRATAAIKADKLTVESIRITLPTKKLPSMEQWEETCTRLKSLDLHAYAHRKEQLEGIKEAIERGEQPELRFDINAVMMGSEWCLLTMSHEPFAEYELWVSEKSPFTNTMVFGDTNGMVTYVATDEELARGDKGGYEAGAFPSLWSHNVRVLHTSLDIGTEEAIKGAIMSLWAN